MTASVEAASHGHGRHYKGYYTTHSRYTWRRTSVRQGTSMWDLLIGLVGVILVVNTVKQGSNTKDVKPQDTLPTPILSSHVLLEPFPSILLAAADENQLHEGEQKEEERQKQEQEEEERQKQQQQEEDERNRQQQQEEEERNRQQQQQQQEEEERNRQQQQEEEERNRQQQQQQHENVETQKQQQQDEEQTRQQEQVQQEQQQQQNEEERQKQQQEQEEQQKQQQEQQQQQQEQHEQERRRLDEEAAKEKQLHDQQELEQNEQHQQLQNNEGEKGNNDQAGNPPKEGKEADENPQEPTEEEKWREEKRREAEEDEKARRNEHPPPIAEPKDDEEQKQDVQGTEKTQEDNSGDKPAPPTFKIDNNVKRRSKPGKGERKEPETVLDDDDLDEDGGDEMAGIHPSAWQPNNLLTFILRAGEIAEFLEDVSEEEEGVIIRGDFFVSAGDEFTVITTIIDPDDETIYESEPIGQGDFKFFAKQGDYRIIFTNPSATSPRVITLAFLKGLDEDDALWKYAKQEDTDDLVKRISSLHQKLDPIIANLHYSDVHFRRHLQTQGSTNARVIWFTLLETCVLLVVMIGQIILIRRLDLEGVSYGKSMV